MDARGWFSISTCLYSADEIGSISAIGCTHLSNNLSLSLRLLESAGMSQLQLLDGMQEGVVGGHDAAPKLRANALGQSGRTETHN